METSENSPELNEIEVRTSTSLKTFIVVVFTSFLLLVIFKLPNNSFQFEKLETILLFLVISVLYIWCWMALLDHKPKFQINKDGFWIRKTILPFSSLVLIKWTDIKLVEYDSIKQKGKTSVFLVILRENSKRNKLELDDVDQPIEDILNVIRKFSIIMNYKDRMKVTQ